MEMLMESCGFRVDRVEVIPYKKSYKALIEGKARYFDVEPRFLYERLNEATERERTIYGIENDSITLFYTIIKGTKRNYRK
jgi:hypothetical protein